MHRFFVYIDKDKIVSTLSNTYTTKKGGDTYGQKKINKHGRHGTGHGIS